MYSCKSKHVKILSSDSNHWKGGHDGVFLQDRKTAKNGEIFSSSDFDQWQGCVTSDERPDGQDCGWEASSSYLEEGVRKLGSGQNICTIHPSPSHPSWRLLRNV